MTTPFNPKNIRQLHSELVRLRDEIIRYEESMASELLSVPRDREADARNLIRFIGFNQLDTSELKHKLRIFGLNSFEQIETDVLEQLDAVIQALDQMLTVLSEKDDSGVKSSLPEFELPQKLSDVSEIKMRTLPVDSAVNYQVTLNLLEEGMDLALIRTRENAPDMMLRMIHNLRRATADLKMKCPIMVDLEDSQIRIGEFEHYSPAIKIEPERNEKGQAIRKAVVFFVLPEYKSTHQAFEIPIECAGYRQMKSNDVVYLRDSAERSRKMIISEVGKGFIKAETDKTIYLDKGIRVMFIRKGEIIDHATIGKIPSREIQITVHKGDTISILPPGMQGQPTILNSKGEFIHPARISCTSRKIFTAAKAGQRVFFGKKQVEGLIKEVSSSQIHVLITRAKPYGNSLYRGKRIYFPDCVNRQTELTETDLQNIEVVGQKADLVCFSVGNDLKSLQPNFTANSGIPKAFVLKIGNVCSLKILPQQLIEGIKMNLAGVWIRQGEISVGQSAGQTDEVIGEIIRWCRAARIMIIRN
jgi:pyruvate kinase